MLTVNSIYFEFGGRYLYKNATWQINPGEKIGGAFGKIVTSLVSDIIMPPIGLILNDVQFKEIKWKLNEGGINAEGKAIDPVTINIGTFIQTAIEFVIVAFAVFMVVKAVNKMRKKEEAAPTPPVAPPQDILLLTEIRDLLKK